jgi:hypothetical protein
MHSSLFVVLVRALRDRAINRRSLAQGVASGVIASSLALLGPEDADAKRRKKKNKGPKRRDGGGNNHRCQFARCDGQCVDLDTNQNHSGACGDICANGSTCAGGRCAVVIGDGSDNIQFTNPGGVAVNAERDAFIVDANNKRIVRFANGALGLGVDQFEVPE